MEGVRIIESARKHGILDEAIYHALRNSVRVIEHDDLVIFIGPAKDGAMLEIGVVEDENEDRVIHAMEARSMYWPPGR